MAPAIPEDTRRFLESLERPGVHSPVAAARAPGRLDVMGGIADYSGSLVLQLTTAEACNVFCMRGGPPIVSVASRRAAQNERSETVSLDLEKLIEGPSGARKPISLAALGSLVSGMDNGERWAGYCIGCLLAVVRARCEACSDAEIDTIAGELVQEGIRVIVDSAVPEGKGVSSSAALEVASMRAFAQLLGAPALQDEQRLAALAQQVENVVVGAPCGIMDQMASAAGRRDHLMALLCRPCQLQGHVPIPSHVRFWGIDSGVCHSVGGSDYGSVRTAAFMGRALLRQHLKKLGDGRPLKHLAEIAPSELDDGLAELLPEEMTGADFLSRELGPWEDVTLIDASRSYAVKRATAHPIYEHYRVQLFREILLRNTRESLELLGELMYQSHASYTSVGLGSDATDAIVRRVRRAAGRGVFGAKITGGGSGGTVCVLTDDSEEAEKAVLEIGGDLDAYVFRGSSPGAYEVGIIPFPLP